MFEPKSIIENIFGGNFRFRVFRNDEPIMQQTGQPVGVGNPAGWIAFCAMLGALLGAIVGRGVIGAIVGALVLGGGLTLIVRLVRGEPLWPRLALPTLPWPLWSLIGALVGAATLLGMAAAVDALDEPAALVTPALTFAAAGAVLFTIIILAKRAMRARRGATNESTPRWQR